MAFGWNFCRAPMQHQNSVQNVYPTHRPTNGRLATATEAAVAWSKANRLRAAVLCRSSSACPIGCPAGQLAAGCIFKRPIECGDLKRALGGTDNQSISWYYRHGRKTIDAVIPIQQSNHQSIINRSINISKLYSALHGPFVQSWRRDVSRYKNTAGNAF